MPGLHKPGQAKWLHDDYVKFLRFSENCIDGSGKGILGFITNHSYIDNATFRCMRAHLKSTFSTIMVLDLHGSSKRKEVTPSGEADENVFDIQQGVAIFLGVSSRASEAVRHQSLWGSRVVKYYELANQSASLVPWVAVNSLAPGHLFVPEDPKARAEFEAGIAVSRLFSVNGDPAPGIVTTQDQFAASVHPGRNSPKRRETLGDAV